MGRSSVVAAAALVFVGVTLGGCAANQEPVLPSGGAVAATWRTDVEALGATTTNDFVRQVTEDGAITQAEMDETFSRLTSCMNDLGFAEFAVIASGSTYSYRAEAKGSADEDGDLLTRCQTSSGDLELTPLYTQIWANPQRIDLDAARSQCLIEVGAGEYTSAQAQEAWQTLQLTGRSPIGDDPATLACLENPTGVTALPARDEVPEQDQ